MTTKESPKSGMKEDKALKVVKSLSDEELVSLKGMVEDEIHLRVDTKVAKGQFATPLPEEFRAWFAGKSKLDAYKAYSKRTGASMYETVRVMHTVAMDRKRVGV
jgi:hypothetical protein